MHKADIFEFVEYMAALIRSEERKKCAELRLQLVHFDVLNYLSLANQYTDTPAATASYFGMTRGTVSQSLIVLEKKGYISKNKDDVDKRIIHVQILPPGQTILKKASRIELFNIATAILKQNKTASIAKKTTVKVVQALQKAVGVQAFSTVQYQNINTLNKMTFFDLIELMATMIRSEIRKKCTELKLQMIHFQILEYLSRCNKYSDTPAAIANYFGMTRGTVSQSLIILEKRLFIKKIQDHHDKRVFHIQLMNPGLELLRRAKPTEMFNKAVKILEKDVSITTADEEIFSVALTALQKANNSFSFGICKSCSNFSKKSSGYFCELTQEKLDHSDSEKICQEHVPV